MQRGQVIARIKSVVAGHRISGAVCGALVAAALASTAAAAQADDVPAATRFAVGSPAMQIAQDTARANWGVDACGGQVTVEWGSDAPNVNARSYWANPLSSYDNPDLNSQCRVVFNTAMTFTWSKFCTVLVHEYGHLTGHPHTADGADVMSPIYRAPLPACTTSDPSEASAPTPIAVPAPSATSTPVAASAALDTPVRRSARPARAATRVKGEGKLRARARTAAAPSKQYGDATVEPMPWAPFAHVDH